MSLAACGGSPSSVARNLVELSGSTMGTYYRVKVVVHGRAPMGDAEIESLKASVEEELERVNRKMSTYLDNSELSQFNASTSTEPFVFTDLTFEVVAEALDIGRFTHGAFDVTVGPLVNAYGFGPEGAKPNMSEWELRRLRSRVGLDLLELDSATRSVAKKRRGVVVDLSGIAKGRAIDLVFDRLAELGHNDVMVEVGGEIRVAGSNVLGRPWRLGIERPQPDRGGVQRVVELTEGALATSGDYRNFREVGGERISHIIDPRSGLPIRHWLASVSVVQPTCARADALATAFMVLGTDEAWGLAEENEIPALFLQREGDDFVERPTSAFARRFLEPDAPGAS